MHLLQFNGFMFFSHARIIGSLGYSSRWYVCHWHIWMVLEVEINDKYVHV